MNEHLSVQTGMTGVELEALLTLSDKAKQKHLTVRDLYPNLDIKDAIRIFNEYSSEGSSAPLNSDFRNLIAKIELNQDFENLVLVEEFRYRMCEHFIFHASNNHYQLSLDPLKDTLADVKAFYDKVKHKYNS